MFVRVLSAVKQKKSVEHTFRSVIEAMLSVENTAVSMVI